MAVPVQPPLMDALREPHSLSSMQDSSGSTASGAAAAVGAAPAALPALDAALHALLRSMEFAFVISDAQRADMPIVYASSSFYTATGYGPDEVIGRNCRFLQGPDTERRKVMEIRDAIREDRCCQVCLLNYRKDGSTFLNQFFLSPIKDDQGIVTHYVGIQTDVSAAAAAGLLEHPDRLQEQQAAVALGTAAGCSMCDVVMQQQQVAAQLQELRKQQQQEPLSGQQQQQQLADGVPSVIAQEAANAGVIRSVFEQAAAAPHADGCGLPSSLLQSLLSVQQAYVLSDPRLPDCPIVHASPQFLAMTGYSREEVVARNCRFLQGPGTDPAEVAKVAAAVSAQPPRPVTVTLLNYKKDGTPFWNALHVAPVRDADGVLEYFIGVQLDVTDRSAAGAAGAAAAGAANGAANADALPPAPCRLHLRDRMAHMTATGAVRVACRSLSGCHGGLRRSMDDQGLPSRGYSKSLSQRRSGDDGSVFGGSARSGSFGSAPAAVEEEGEESVAVAAGAV